MPCPRAVLLAPVPSFAARASLFCSPPRHPLQPAGRPLQPAHRPLHPRAALLLPSLLRTTLLLPTLLRTALLASNLLPAQPSCAPPCCLRRPAATRPAVRSPAGRCPPVGAPPCCPRAALLAPAPPCPSMRAPLVLKCARAALPACRPGRPIQFDTWLDDLQLYLLSDSRDSVSLFDHTSGASLAPPATADSATRSQWLTRDAAARLAVRNHLPLAECANFGQHKTAKALYDAVVARYSSPATAALGRLTLPYLFPELSAFATVEDLVTHSRTSNAHYRAALPAEFPDRNPPPIQGPLDPTDLTVDLLEKHLLPAETSIVAVGAARGTPRTPFFEGCSPSPLAPSYASAAAVDILGVEDIAAASALSGKCRSSKSKGGKSGGGGSGGGGGGGSGGGGGGGSGGSGGSGGGSGGFGDGGGGSGGVGGGGGGGRGSGGSGSGGGRGGAVQRGGSGGGQRQQLLQRRSQTPTPQQLLDIFALDYDAIIAAMYALSVSAEGDCYLCVPPDPDIEAAALGASDSALPGTARAEALHTFTLDSARVRGQDRERYFLLVVDDYTRYTTVFPLHSKGEVPDVPGDTRTRGIGAVGAGGVGGAGAGDPGAGGTGAGGAGAGGAGAGDLGAGGARAGGTSARDARDGGTGAGGTGVGGARVGAGGTNAGGAGAGGNGAGDPGAEVAGARGARASDPGAGGTVQRCPFVVPPPPSSLAPPESVLCLVLSLSSSIGLPPSLLSPPPHQSKPQSQLESPMPAPSPYAEQADSFTELREPESRPASPLRAVRTGRRVPRPRPPPFPGTHIMALRPSSVPLRVPLPSPPSSSLPHVPDPESDLARAASPTVPRLLATVVTDPSFESTAASALVAELVDFAAT
ncbi:unnamed protein product [Closterium sp. NIES-53]